MLTPWGRLGAISTRRRWDTSWGIRSSRGDILRMVAMGQVRLGSIVGSDFYALMRRCTFRAELHGPLKCQFLNISVRADCLPQAAPCGPTVCQLGSTIHELDRMQQALE